jgi:prevent-host-death family protein
LVDGGNALGYRERSIDRLINQSEKYLMTRKITAVTARTQFGQIIDRAVDHNERFLVERNGEPAVLILSVTDFVKTLAPAPDWLKDIQDHAKRQGLDKLTMDDINAEIAAARRGRRERHRQSGG